MDYLNTEEISTYDPRTADASPSDRGILGPFPWHRGIIA